MTISGIYIKVTSFLIYLNFRDTKILTKYSSDTASLYFRNRHFYQNLACGAHIQFNNHDLKMLIGIKSLNTKQFSARLSPPPVKLSGFIGVKFSPKKGESNL